MRGDIHRHTAHGYDHWIVLQHTENTPTRVCAPIAPAHPDKTSNHLRLPLPVPIEGLPHLKRDEAPLRYPLIHLDQIHTLTLTDPPVHTLTPDTTTILDDPLTVFLGLLK